MQKEINKNLIHLNTFGIEEFCDEYFEVEDILELSELSITNETLILGGGSNIIITKKLPEVIHINTKGIEKIYENDKIVKLKVQAGEIWDDFVSFCVENNYYGAENLSLIPGTVGASPIQNIGAYGAEVKDIIENVEYFDIKSKLFKIIENKDCLFEYRDSIFKNELKGKVVVSAVTYILNKNGELNISYGGLKNHFLENEPTLQSVRQAVIDTRNNKLPDYKILGNCGSFFKNAIVDKQKLDELKSKYEKIPYFEVNEGFKIPTAWLIETAGLKGFRHKNAGVYENHALILVNYGGTKANDVLELSEIIENKIFDKFGVKIFKEVNVI